MNSKQQLFLNLFCSIMGLVTEILINFILTPYIVSTLGVAAKGFLSLSMNLISYLALVTVAINSMSSRFISVHFHLDEKTEANKYYSSVLIANIAIILTLLLPCIAAIVYIDRMLDIPADMVFETQLLLLLVLINYFISTLSSVWQTSVYVANKLFRHSINLIISYLVRIIVIYALFGFCGVKVYYVGIASIASSLVLALLSYMLKREILPEMIFQITSCSIKHIFKVVSAGIWNTVSQTGVVLLKGLDLLIANNYLGANVMGIISIAYTIPNVLIYLLATASGVFLPELYMTYAKKDKQCLIDMIHFDVKVLSFIMAFPVAMTVAYSEWFYQLWMPGQDSKLLFRLTVLACFYLVITSGVGTYFNLFTVLNKLKSNSLSILITGVISTIVTLLLVVFTSWEMYVIAGVSSAVSVLRIVGFMLPYVAHCLQLRKRVVYKDMIYSIIYFIPLWLIGYFINIYFRSYSWLALVGAVAINCVLGAVVLFFVAFRSNERRKLVAIFQQRLGWNKNKNTAVQIVGE